MTGAPRGDTFLKIGPYRRRRRADALRLLPVLGLILMLVPLMWTRGPDGMTTATALIYLFSVWALLIWIARIFAVRLARDDSGAPDQEDPAETDLANDTGPDRE